MNEKEAEKVKAKLIRYNDLNISISELEVSLDLLKHQDFTNDVLGARDVKSVTIELKSGAVFTLEFQRNKIPAFAIRNDLEGRLRGVLLDLVNEVVAL